MTRDVADVAKTALVEELEELHRAVVGVVNDLNDQELWRKPTDPGNSVGHLVLHLTGNLNHFVGAHLGKTGYIREREREFTETQPPERTELLKGLADAVATFRRVVTGLTAEQLAAPHPDPKWGLVFKALVHVVAHFALHRGQMSYIVRFVKTQT